MPLLDIRNLTIEIDTPQGKVKAVDKVSLTPPRGRSAAWWANPAPARA